MELREIYTFLQIAKLGSFSKAADALGYSQAAVTIQIQHLEKELDTRLFDRIGKKVFLTPNGERFFLHARNIAHEIAAVREEMHERCEPCGELAIGTIESLSACVFPDLLAQYHRAYPKVSIKVTLDSPSVLMSQLNKNTLELVYLADRKISDPNWIKVFEEPEDVVFVSAASNPILRRPNLTLAQLVEEPFILTEPNASYRALLDSYLTSENLQIRPFIHLGNTEFIVRMIKNGTAVSFLPRYMVRDELDAGQLAVVTPVDFPPIQVWRQLFYHKDKWITAEMQAFISLVQRPLGTAFS